MGRLTDALVRDLTAASGLQALAGHSAGIPSKRGGPRFGWHNSAFNVCPGDPEDASNTGPAPPCLEGGSACSSTEEQKALLAFARRVDDSVKEALKDARKYRQIFERRVCDYQYAQIQNKDDELVAVYGPAGPMGPGGSYLYALEKWTNAVKELYRACGKGQGGCKALLEHFRKHPEDDLGAADTHGKAGSGVYTEFRLACEVGETRSPVPNDSPVWCDSASGVCEQPSCRKWWQKVHEGLLEPGQKEPDPWTDDRPAYEELKNICSWTKTSRPSLRDMDNYNKMLDKTAARMKHEYCVPRWIEGYCEPKPRTRYAHCTLANGQHCENGFISAETPDLNMTTSWSGRFPERPIRSAGLPDTFPRELPVMEQMFAQWFSVAVDGVRGTREASAMKLFL